MKVRTTQVLQVLPQVRIQALRVRILRARILQVRIRILAQAPADRTVARRKPETGKNPENPNPGTNDRNRIAEKDRKKESRINCKNIWQKQRREGGREENDEKLTKRVKLQKLLMYYHTQFLMFTSLALLKKIKDSLSNLEFLEYLLLFVKIIVKVCIYNERPKK